MAPAVAGSGIAAACAGGQGAQHALAAQQPDQCAVVGVRRRRGAQLLQLLGLGAGRRFVQIAPDDQRCALPYLVVESVGRHAERVGKARCDGVRVVVEVVAR